MKRISKTIEQQAKYYEVEDFVIYLEECYINGNFSSCRNIFKELKRDERKRAINQMYGDETKKFYINEI